MKECPIAFSEAATIDIETTLGRLVDVFVADSAAKKLIDLIDKTVKRIQLFPLSAPILLSSTNEKTQTRVANVGPYLLFYTYEEETGIRVLRFLHSSQDWETWIAQ